MAVTEPKGTNKTGGGTTLDDIGKYIKDASNEYQVSEAFICAILMTESAMGTNVNAYKPNSADAMGISQFIPTTAASYGVKVYIGNPPNRTGYNYQRYVNELKDIDREDYIVDSLDKDERKNDYKMIVVCTQYLMYLLKGAEEILSNKNLNTSNKYFLASAGYIAGGKPRQLVNSGKWDGSLEGSGVLKNEIGPHTYNYVSLVSERMQKYISLGYTDGPSEAPPDFTPPTSSGGSGGGSGNDGADEEEVEQAEKDFTGPINTAVLEEFYIWVGEYDDVKFDKVKKLIYIENKVYKQAKTNIHPIPDGEYFFDTSTQRNYIKRRDTPDSLAEEGILDRLRKNENYKKNLIPPWYKPIIEIDKNPKYNPLDESFTVISNGKQITYYKGEYFLLNGRYYVEDLSQGRYKYTKYLDGLQHDPHRMKTVNFKQDYTVIIRKKTHYAATQGLKNKENYIKVYQINDFTSISTSHHVEQKGNATVTIRGATKVVVADKRDVVDNKGTKRWNSSFEDLTLSFNDIDKEFKGTWKGIEYNDIQNVRERKYNWAYAEKCDFEPMDEIHIFSKSPVKNKDGYYDFKKIFFGYIGSITKQFNAGSGGPTISISAFDQTRLLELSRVMAKGGSALTEEFGTVYRFDGAGNFVVEDDPLNIIDLNINDMDPTTGKFGRLKKQSYFYQNIFAYILLHEIIIRHCVGSGIPIEFLQNRIELINRIPFYSDVGGNTELTYNEFKDRYSICKEAANKLNIEFFCDEEGQIVLKIPTYNIGINRKKDNNLGIESQVVFDKGLTRRYVKAGDSEVDQNYSNYTYTPLKNETLWEIARRFFGDASMWTKVHSLNKKVINVDNGGNTYVPAGKEIIIKEGKKSEYEEQLYTDLSYNDDNDFTLSSLTDRYVPIIYPEEIIQFTFQDSESGIYTAAEVKVEIPLINNMQMPPQMTTRAVADFDLIRKFGVRVLPISGTTIPTDAASAEVYAGLMIMRSLSMRYTGSLTMIENPNIKIGIPIRIFLYDEHIFTELYRIDKNNDFSMAQAIFYVDGITRNIDVKGVSTMSLTLKAGRMVGMPSIYDKATELYRYFHDDILIDSGTQQVSAVINNAKTNSKNTPSAKHQNYTIQSGDTISIIGKKFYGNKSDYEQKKFQYQKKIIDLNKKTSNGKNGYVDFNKALPAGVPIKIPTDVNSIYTVKARENIGSIVERVYKKNTDYLTTISSYIDSLVTKNQGLKYKDGTDFNKNKIEAGQVLKNPLDVSKTYTVQQGDTFGGIIHRFYSKNKQYLKSLSSFMYEIEKLNKQTKYNKKPFDKNTLYENMQIVIPYIINVSLTLSQPSGSNIKETSIKLTWSINPSTAKVSRYDIYVNGKLKHSTTKTTFTVEGLKTKTQYGFVIKAFDSNNNPSTKSNTIYVPTK